MSRYKLTLSPLLLVFVVSSCRIVGYTSGLNRLSLEQRQRVIEANSPIVDLPQDSNIYICSEKQFIDYIKNQDSCIVYEWIAYCPHNIHTPGSFESFCDSLGYTPIIVLSAFCPQAFSSYDATHTPLLFPDINAYKTDLVYSYMDSLRQNLTGVVPDEAYRYWCFKHGAFRCFLDTVFWDHE